MTGGRFILLSETDCLDVFPYSFCKRTTNFHCTAVAIRINTEGIQNYQEVIDAARKQGEETAKTIKNVFKRASVPSKGLLSDKNWFAISKIKGNLKSVQPQSEILFSMRGGVYSPTSRNGGCILTFALLAMIYLCV